MLFNSLNKLGISNASVHAVLPHWWDDSLADDPAGMTELKVILARRLSLDPSTLFDESKSVEFLPVVRRYKGGREELMQKLGASTAIASSLCRTALAFTREQNIADFKNPEILRQEILSSGAEHVGLAELLDVCWRAGVPVLHVTLPEKLRKFDALVTTSGDRYGIALCRNEDSEAWLAFHLAHEMGHIACGHLDADGMLVDEKIEATSVTVQQEREANDYAVRLLGSLNIDPPALNYKNISTIASNFHEVARAAHVLPGHLVLKAGSQIKDFKCARIILSIVEGKTLARKSINKRSFSELSENWNYEAEEFLAQFSHYVED